MPMIFAAMYTQLWLNRLANAEAQGMEPEGLEKVRFTATAVQRDMDYFCSSIKPKT